MSPWTPLVCAHLIQIQSCKGVYSLYIYMYQKQWCTHIEKVKLFAPLLLQTILVKIILYKNDYNSHSFSCITINNSFSPITSMYLLFSLQHYSRHFIDLFIWYPVYQKQLHLYPRNLLLRLFTTIILQMAGVSCICQPQPLLVSEQTLSNCWCILPSTYIHFLLTIFRNVIYM